MRTMTTTSASARKIGGPVSAVATPWASSCGLSRAEPATGGAGAARAAAKTVMRMPRPSEAPSCWATLSRPEAAPASRGATPAMPAAVSGVKAMPMPTPTSASGTAICGK